MNSIISKSNESDVVIKEILAAENARCEALLAANKEVLNDLLTDDLVHVHATGKVEGKKDYVEAVGSRMTFLKIARSDLQVKLLGDVAIMTGVVIQTLRIAGREADRVMTAIGTQVWINKSGKWKQTSFQLSEIH